MNVFEELIDELKEENLLEETVIALNRAAQEKFQAEKASPAEPVQRTAAVPEASFEETDSDADELNKALPPAGEPEDERDAYRRRAMDEVSSLQMVEHVLSGIEREHMKMSPVPFDDLAVKKALHKYLQVTSAIDSAEHSEVEYALFQETENWFSALSKRDFDISVANVRRFCENSRPVLSSQALMALSRFYRNSPFAESVRGKFDFVITKLFSREIGDEKRKLLFQRVEMLGHIQTLYANWASLSLADPDSEGPSVGDAVLAFENFVKEAEEASSFDVLIASDFFNRIRLYKEDSAELFFEPAVTAAAIECNVRIGNRFIDLIQQEREASSHESVEEKYGYSYDTIISNATSKTLLLLDLLRMSREVEYQEEEEEVPVKRITVTDFERAPVEVKKSFTSLVANKWLVGLTVLVVLASVAIYMWSETASGPASGGVEVAPAIELTGDFKQHLREASHSSETMYAVTLPTWDALSDAEKKEFLGKTMEFAKTMGLKRVNLMNSRGRTVGFAGGQRIEVFLPQ